VALSTTRTMSSKSSTTDGSIPETILVGLIHKPHGLRGEVSVESFSDLEGRFAVGSAFHLAVPGVPRRDIRVRSCRPGKRGLLVGFDGVTDRDRAEEIRGGRLEVDRSEVPPAPEGEYYYFELIGCRCVDAELGELGTVREVMEDGGGQILLIEGEQGVLLVPFVKAFLVNVNIAERRIEIEAPEGLVETCRSKS